MPPNVPNPPARELQDALRTNDIQGMLDRFGEPEAIHPLDTGYVEFKYPHGSASVLINLLIKLSPTMKSLDFVELREPWTFHNAGEWSGPHSNTNSIIADFSLDKVPGSRFVEAVVKNIDSAFPPKIVHHFFDVLSPEVQQAIIDKLKPNIPTPEQSAARHWKEVLNYSLVDKLREIIIHLQISGTPNWCGRALYIGKQKIDFKQLYSGGDIFPMDAADAVKDLLTSTKRLLDMQLDPRNATSQPDMTEPLLGIDSLIEWRQQYIDAFNEIKERAGIERLDAERLAQRTKLLSQTPDIPVGMVHALPARDPHRSAAQTIGRPELNEIAVDQKGWFRCPEGHSDKLKGEEKRRLQSLKQDERIELYCGICRAAVGVVMGK